LFLLPFCTSSQSVRPPTSFVLMSTDGCELCSSPKISAKVHYSGQDRVVRVCRECASNVERRASAGARVELLASLSLATVNGRSVVERKAKGRSGLTSAEWSVKVKELQAHVERAKEAKAAQRRAQARTTLASSGTVKVRSDSNAGSETGSGETRPSRGNSLAIAVSQDDMSVDRRRGTSGELDSGSSPALILSTTPGTPPSLATDLLGPLSNSDPMPSFRSKAMRRRSVAIAFNVTTNDGDGDDEASFEQSMLAMLQSAGVKSENRPFCERCRKRVSSTVVFPDQCALKVCTACSKLGPQSEAAMPLPTRVLTTPVGSVRELLDQTRVNAALWSAKEVCNTIDGGDRRLAYGDPLRFVLGPLVDASVGALPVYRPPPEDAPPDAESTYTGTVSIDQCTFYCLERYEEIMADTSSFMAGNVGSFVDAYSFAELAPRTVLESDPFTNVVWRLANHRPVGLTRSTLEHAPVTSTLSVTGALRFISNRVLDRSPSVTAKWTVADLECFTNTDVCTVSGHMLAVDALRVVRRRGVASVAVVNDAGALVASFGPHCLRFLTAASFKLLKLPLNSFFAEVSKLHPASARLNVDASTGAVHDRDGEAGTASASTIDLAATLAGFLNPLSLSLDHVETMPVTSAVELLLSAANPLKLLWILSGRKQVVAVLRADRLLRYLAAADARLRVRNLAPPPLPITPASTGRGVSQQALSLSLGSLSTLSNGSDGGDTSGGSTTPRRGLGRKRVDSTTIASDAPGSSPPPGSPKPGRVSGLFGRRLRRQSSSLSSSTGSAGGGADDATGSDDSSAGERGLAPEAVFALVGVHPARRLLGSPCLSLLFTERPEDGLPRVVSLTTEYLERNKHVLAAFVPFVEPPREAQRLVSWFDENLAEQVREMQRVGGSGGGDAGGDGNGAGGGGGSGNDKGALRSSGNTPTISPTDLSVSPSRGPGNDSRYSLLPLDLSSPRSIAALLYLWLDSLSTPLVPARLVPLFLDATHFASTAARTARLHFLLASLQPADQVVMAHLLRFIRTVAFDARNVAKDALSQLVKFFAPVLLKGTESASTKALHLALRSLVIDAPSLTSRLVSRRGLWELYPLLQRVDIAGFLASSAIRKGFLLKLSAKSPSVWHRRYFFIVPPHVIYSKEEGDIRPSGVITLDKDSTVGARDPTGDRAEYRGHIVLRTVHKTLTLATEGDNVELTNSWIKALKGAVPTK